MSRLLNPFFATSALLTTLATALYGVGLFTPMATIETKFMPFVNQSTSYSLVRTIRNIFTDGDYVLGVVLVLFTFVFPVTKFFSLYMGLWRHWRPHNSPLYRFMRATGRWSMLDVFVVAILVVFLRVRTLGGGMSMTPEMGIYCFGASVLLAIWAGERIDRIEVGADATEATPESALAPRSGSGSEPTHDVPRSTDTPTGRVGREPA